MTPALKSQQSDVLFEFRSYPCSKSKDAVKGINDTIKKTEWLNDSALSVIIQVSLNCAENILRGSYEIKDSTIILNYYAPRCGDKSLPCAKCVCNPILEYKFKNIVKKDFLFVIKRIE
jgi:hypothetical protein